MNECRKNETFIVVHAYFTNANADDFFREIDAIISRKKKCITF